MRITVYQLSILHRIRVEGKKTYEQVRSSSLKALDKLGLIIYWGVGQGGMCEITKQGIALLDKYNQRFSL